MRVLAATSASAGNEEQQSFNEELSTLNNQLHDKNAELEARDERLGQFSQLD